MLYILIPQNHIEVRVAHNNLRNNIAAHIAQEVHMIRTNTEIHQNKRIISTNILKGKIISIVISRLTETESSRKKNKTNNNMMRIAMKKVKKEGNLCWRNC